MAETAAVLPYCTTCGMVQTLTPDILAGDFDPQTVYTERWYPLLPHGAQLRLSQSDRQFVVVCAGRRSGKTERVKRKVVHCAIWFHVFMHLWYRRPVTRGRFLFTAPTAEQTKQIYWNDLKELIPDWALRGGDPRKAIRESYPQTIYLWNGGVPPEICTSHNESPADLRSRSGDSGS